MPPFVLEILIIATLLLLNGVLAMSEIAIVTSRRGRLKRLADRGDRRAGVAATLSENPTRFLSTVQVGITLIGVMAGAFGGATLAEELAVVFERIAAIEPWHEELALGVVVATITFFSLVVGEIVPKRIALSAPERIALIVAYPMRFLARVARPLVAVLSFFTGAILRLLRIRESISPSMCR
jgi:putative hemolysin